MRSLTIFILLTSAVASAQDATTPGEITTPHPTLENASIEWAITGDDDEDATVSVRFREAGSGAFRAGHPLFRVPAGSNEGFDWTNRFSGSLFGLVPGTTYEVELTLSDPDGGDATETTMVTTRPVPAVADDAPELMVDPGSIASALGAASPGDVLVLQAGTYSDISVNRSGSPGAPIVLRGVDPSTVIVEGEVRMDGQTDVWIERMTVRGQIKFNNSANIVVRECTIETEGDGIVAFGEGTTDGYFADNTVIGPTVWELDALGASGDNLGEGIVVTGPGNVIAHNRVENFRDCVSLLEDDGANEQLSIDIIGNDLRQCADDAIEADFAMGNVRVLRNRSTNSFIAWSSQPSLGGPTWFVRNVAFANFFQVFKPNRSSEGDVLYHNTVVKQGDALGVYTGDAWGRATFRNNLFIGGPEVTSAGGFDTGPGSILNVASLRTNDSSFDYDGFGSHELGRFDGRFGDVRFDDFAELRSMTTEANAVQVDVDVFASPFDFPQSMFPSRDPVDLRLADGSAAVDVGLALANINDGFAGAAPDLGAYEAGSSLPPYGPRTGVVAECGNGAIERGETCDDSNRTSGDGCSASCQLEDGDGGPGSDAGPRFDGGPEPDGGAVDAGGADAGPDEGGGGCGCRTSGAGDVSWAVLLLIALRRQRSSGCSAVGRLTHVSGRTRKTT